MATPKHMVVQAVKVINERFGRQGGLPGGYGEATLIDWSADGDGYAINVEELGFDAMDVAADATVHGALPRGTFLEPLDSAALRLVRA